MRIDSSPASVLFSKARRAVLGCLYAHPDRRFYLREIVEIAQLGLGSTQRELKLLFDAGVIRRSREGRHVYFQADEHCPIYDELRSIVTKTIGAVDVLRHVLDPLAERIVVAFVFGSVARGEQGNESDLDLMVIGDVSFADVVDVIREAETRIRREVNPTVFPCPEFQAKLARRNHFLVSVLKRDKVFVVGDQHELDALSAEHLDT